MLQFKISTFIHLQWKHPYQYLVSTFFDIDRTFYLDFANTEATLLMISTEEGLLTAENNENMKVIKNQHKTERRNKEKRKKKVSTRVEKFKEGAAIIQCKFRIFGCFDCEDSG